MSLLEHAQKELATSSDVRYQNALMGAVKAFAPYHMQINIGSFLHTLEQLLTFQATSPFTDDPDEWNFIAETVWQSRRQADIFSKDGGLTYYSTQKPEEVFHTVRTKENHNAG